MLLFSLSNCVDRYWRATLPLFHSLSQNLTLLVDVPDRRLSPTRLVCCFSCRCCCRRRSSSVLILSYGWMSDLLAVVEVAIVVVMTMAVVLVGLPRIFGPFFLSVCYSRKSSCVYPPFFFLCPWALAVELHSWDAITNMKMLPGFTPSAMCQVASIVQTRGLLLVLLRSYSQLDDIGHVYIGVIALFI